MDHCPRLRLVVCENTTYQGGGFPWLRAELDEVQAVARGLSLVLHLDGPGS